LRGLRGRARFELDLDATYALSHGSALLTVDADFHAMKKKGSHSSSFP
jgi:hypothetical protein